MLEGGTAPITSVMGGGAQKKHKIKRALKLLRKKLSKRKKLGQTKRYTRKRLRGGAGHYMLREESAFEELPDIDTLKVRKMAEPAEQDNAPFRDVTRDANNRSATEIYITEYNDNSKALWVRYGGSSAVTALTGQVMIPSNPAKTLTQTGSDRLCAILPNSTKKIIVFPPISGNIELFKKYVSLAFGPDREPTQGEDTSYIFTCPFFGDESTNKFLFTYFIQVKHKIHTTSSRIYILTEHSSEHISKSRAVAREITPGSDSAAIYPLLEPTYIVYPYAVNIEQFTSNGDKIPDLEPDSRKGILFSGRIKNEPVLPAADSSMEGLIAGLLKNIQSDTYGIAYKPDITKVDPGLTSMNFRVIESKDIDTSYYYIYDKELGKAAVSTLDGFSSIFLANSDAYVEDVSLVPVELGTQEFSLRTSIPRVKDDWKNGIFTTEEANFLNSLNVNPQRLSKLYREIWKQKLAQILTVISRSKCFKDTSIILHAECQEVQSFIGKVFADFVNNADDIIDLEKNQMQATVANLTAKILGENSGSGSAITASKDIFNAPDFTAAFYSTPNPKYAFTFIKEPNADIKMDASPGFAAALRQYSIDALVVDLLNKTHYKAQFIMKFNGLAPTATLSEKDISDANDDIVTEYRRIKKETEKPASTSKFPRYQIILPE
jgi:hypothetical protein